MQVNTKNMTKKLIDTDTVGKTGNNLGEIWTLEYQAETDMGTDFPEQHIFLALSQKTRSKSLEDPQNVGGQGRLAMRHVHLNNGRHLNERFV